MTKMEHTSQTSQKRPRHITRPPDGCMSIQEAAERIGCSIRTVRVYMASGRIQSVKPCGRRFPVVASIERLLTPVESNDDAVRNAIARRQRIDASWAVLNAYGIYRDGDKKNETNRRK